VGGALLIHALLAGVIVVGTFFPWAHNPGGSARGGTPDAAAPGGFLILGSGPDDNASSYTNPIYTAGKPDAGAPVLPTLAPLPETPSRDLAAQFVPPPTPQLPPDNLGTVRVTQPDSVMANSPTVAPQQSTGAEGAIAGTAGSRARGSDSGNGGGSDDQPSFDWVKGGGITNTNGLGSGFGPDRGMSAADRNPQLLNFGEGESGFALPLKYQLKPPAKSVKFTISVAADGTIAAVHLDQSCGITDVDDLAKAYIIANVRFSPAYRAGKAVTADFPFEYSFKPFD
jgi:hypothetical protein